MSTAVETIPSAVDEVPASEPEKVETDAKAEEVKPKAKKSAAPKKRSASTHPPFLEVASIVLNSLCCILIASNFNVEIASRFNWTIHITLLC